MTHWRRNQFYGIALNEATGAPRWWRAALTAATAGGARGRPLPTLTYVNHPPQLSAQVRNSVLQNSSFIQKKPKSQISPTPETPRRRRRTFPRRSAAPPDCEESPRQSGVLSRPGGAVTISPRPPSGARDCRTPLPECSGDKRRSGSRRARGDAATPPPIPSSDKFSAV